MLAGGNATAAPPWPQGPVRVLVPAPPGGVSDMTARLLAERLGTMFKQPFVVENMAGASGTIAARALMKSAPDGSVLMVGPNGIVTEVPHVMTLPFDPLKEMLQVAKLSHSPMVLVGTASLPATTLDELVQYAKANPGKLGIASYSPGTRSQYAGILFNAKAGLDLLQVPYKGSPPVITDLIAGHMALAFDVVPNMLPYIRAGKMKAFALAAGSRSPLLPEVPTFAERGFPDLQFSGWMSLWVTGRTSEVLAGQIHEAVWRAWNTPAVRERLLAAGFDPVADKTLAQQRDELKAQSSFNQGIVQRVGIKLE
jgi:tripartite-type tricarboxylate transporter receptor subunit TctC